jgi:hypothetical protein
MIRKTVVLALACAFALALVWAAPQATQQIIQKVKPPLLCSDFTAVIQHQDLPDGTVQLSGRICNAGPGGYSNATGALDAYYMVYTWHPPKTPAQEANLKFYQHTDLGTAMKANECKIVTLTYKIENFSRWGTFPTTATERQAMKQFCFRVEKKGTTGFSPCEDSNIPNTTACFDLAYMEKIVK